MKKLLVLMFILCLASAANAALSLGVNGSPAPDEITINVNDTFILDIRSSGSNNYFTKLWFPVGPGTISNLHPTQSNSSDIIAGTYTPYDYFDIFVGDSSGSVVPGIGVEGTFHCDGEGDVLITLNDYNTNEIIDSLLIHQVVPEPMTLSLLGLGGLFLRRRR